MNNDFNADVKAVNCLTACSIRVGEGEISPAESTLINFVLESRTISTPNSLAVESFKDLGTNIRALVKTTVEKIIKAMLFIYNYIKETGKKVNIWFIKMWGRLISLFKDIEDIPYVSPDTQEVVADIIKNSGVGTDKSGDDYDRREHSKKVAKEVISAINNGNGDKVTKAKAKEIKATFIESDKTGKGVKAICKVTTIGPSLYVSSIGAYGSTVEVNGSTTPVVAQTDQDILETVKEVKLFGKLVNTYFKAVIDEGKKINGGLARINAIKFNKFIEDGRKSRVTFFDGIGKLHKLPSSTTLINGVLTTNRFDIVNSRLTIESSTSEVDTDELITILGSEELKKVAGVRQSVQDVITKNLNLYEKVSSSRIEIRIGKLKGNTNPEMVDRLNGTLEWMNSHKAVADMNNLVNRSIASLLEKRCTLGKHYLGGKPL